MSSSLFLLPQDCPYPTLCLSLRSPLTPHNAPTQPPPPSQVSDRSSPATILGQLDELAKTADVSTRKGLAQLVSSTCLALLRSSGDWVCAHGESQ